MSSSPITATNSYSKKTTTSSSKNEVKFIIGNDSIKDQFTTPQAPNNVISGSPNAQLTKNKKTDEAIITTDELNHSLDQDRLSDLLIINSNNNRSNPKTFQRLV